MLSEEVTKSNGALDWLTMTTQKQPIGLDWASIWLQVKGAAVEEAGFFGFSGFRSKTGSFYGQRMTDGRYILILAGTDAHKYYPRVTPCKCRITRLDLATDLWMKEATTHIKDQATKMLARDFKTKAKVTYIEGLKAGGGRPLAGNTLYIGSRQSQQFGRLYDKGLQMGIAPEGIWIRYEMEFKAEAASVVLKAVNDVGLEGAGNFIQQACYDWFRERGCEPNFEPRWETDRFKVRSFIRQTTRDKKLMWLRTQVRPTVEYLLSEGLDTHVISALGMEGWTNKEKTCLGPLQAV